MFGAMTITTYCNHTDPFFVKSLPPELLRETARGLALLFEPGVVISSTEQEAPCAAA
jgi:hypothetical protein